MAERRMFAKTIIDSDAFLDMGLGSQALYFHLSMRADDEGFINAPKKIMRMIGASEDEYKVLEAKKFILPFESGIVVIKHWRIHNYIQKDRFKRTLYAEEREMLGLKENNVYTMDTECMQNGDTGKVRLGKVRLGKVNKTNTADKSACESLFDQFWSNYDKKRDRKKCLEQWSKKMTTEQREISIVKAKEQKEAVEQQFRKDPIRWLKGECWNDEIIKKQAIKSKNLNNPRGEEF